MLSVHMVQTVGFESSPSLGCPPSPKRLQDWGGLQRTQEDWRGLGYGPKALAANHLVTKVERHQLVRKTAWPFPPFGTKCRSFLSGQQLTPIRVALDHELITKTLGQVRSIRPASCPRTGTKGRNVRRRQLREIGSSNQASAFWSVRPSKGVVRQKAIRSRFYGSPVIRAGCDVICL